MCTCGHGGDRHYLDYAGPDICGGVLSRCLEAGCSCQQFKAWNVIVTPVNVQQGFTFPNQTTTGLS
jgi:hypothetical protein